MPAWLSVVGIGEDGWDGLSAAARQVLSQATAIYGGARHLAMLPPALEADLQPWPRPFSLQPLLARRGVATCVLASGDPMHHGVGAVLAAQLPAAEWRILPAVSSISLAAARMGWALQSVSVISLLQTPVATVTAACQPGRRLLLLSAGAETPGQLAASLCAAGGGECMLSVWQRLGGSAEARLQLRAADWPPGQVVDPLNVVALQCPPQWPAWPPGPGLPDAAYRHDGQLTKQDVRAITLARLGPRPGELLWDVGAGCGSIGIEWMRSDPGCRALAIEADPGRLAMIEYNSRQLGVPGLQRIAGTAPQALQGLAAPDAIFIGGGLTTPGLLAACWQALPAGGRLVANAVTLQGEQVLQAWRQSHGGQLSRIALDHAEPLGRYDSWRRALPVVLYAVSKP